MSNESNRRFAVVLTAEELEFVKDALWYASRAEQIALADDPMFRESFLAELREFSNRREQDGKPGFQDLFLALHGTPVERLPVDAQRTLGVVDAAPADQLTARSAGPREQPDSPVPPGRISGRQGRSSVFRRVREFFLGE